MTIIIISILALASSGICFNALSKLISECVRVERGNNNNNNNNKKQLGVFLNSIVLLLNKRTKKHKAAFDELHFLFSPKPLFRSEGFNIHGCSEPLGVVTPFR